MTGSAALPIRHPRVVVWHCLEARDGPLGLDGLSFIPPDPGLRGLPLGSRVWPLQGRPLPVARRRKVQALVSSGVRLFESLMEEGETNRAGDPFVPYAELAQQLCHDVLCIRHPIRDLSVPTQARMRDVLDTIDQAANSRKAVYVHCWGGVGRARDSPMEANIRRAVSCSTAMNLLASVVDWDGSEPFGMFANPFSFLNGPGSAGVVFVRADLVGGNRLEAQLQGG